MFPLLLVLVLGALEQAAPPTQLTVTVNAQPAVEIYQLERNSDLTLTLPYVGRFVRIEVSGFPLWHDEYTIDGLTVTIHDPCWPSDEIVTATIFR